MPGAHLLPVFYDIGECRSSHLYPACDKSSVIYGTDFFSHCIIKRINLDLDQKNFLGFVQYGFSWICVLHWLQVEQNWALAHVSVLLLLCYLLGVMQFFSYFWWAYVTGSVMVLMKAPLPQSSRVEDHSMQAYGSKLIGCSNFSVFFFHDGGFAKTLSAYRLDLL